MRVDEVCNERDGNGCCTFRRLGWLYQVRVGGKLLINDCMIRTKDKVRYIDGSVKHSTRTYNHNNTLITNHLLLYFLLLDVTGLSLGFAVV